MLANVSWRTVMGIHYARAAPLIDVVDVVEIHQIQERSCIGPAEGEFLGCSKAALNVGLSPRLDLGHIAPRPNRSDVVELFLQRG